MSIEAMKQALEALEWNLPVIEDYGDKEQLNRQHKAITSLYDALRQAIEQAEKQEPTEDMVLALRGASGLGTEDAIDALRDVLAVMPLYTTPQPQREWVDVECPLCGEMAVAHTHSVLNKRKWVGLTLDEIDLLEELYAPPVHSDFVNDASHCLELIRHVEAKLKQKNGYAEEKNT